MGTKPDPVYRALCMSYDKENIKVENEGGNLKIGFVFDFSAFEKWLIKFEVENYREIIDKVHKVIRPIVAEFMLNISSDLMYNPIDDVLREKIIQAQWNAIIRVTDLPLPDYIYSQILSNYTVQNMKINYNKKGD